MRLERWNRIFTIFLAVVITGAIGTLYYVLAIPKGGESFTEFYVLGLEGKAENYPRELTPEQEGKVILGIVNQEHETTNYKLEITTDGENVAGIGPITLRHEEKWEQEVAFAFTRPGLSQKVEFLLYNMASPEPYQRLYLWIDVKEAL